MRKGGVPFQLAKGLDELGLVQGRSGDREKATRTLEEAATIFQKIGASVYSERVRASIASLNKP